MMVLDNTMKWMKDSLARFVPNIRQRLAEKQMIRALAQAISVRGRTTCLHTDSRRRRIGACGDYWYDSPATGPRVGALPIITISQATRRSNNFGPGKKFLFWAARGM
jgi:hypothetical protein